MGKDAFSGYHPVINFIFFVEVLVFSMCFMHPVSLSISLVCSMAYAVFLGGKKTLRFYLRLLLPMMLMAAVLNPAFNHQGVTVLTYLPSGNPLTMESIVYGFAAAVMLASVVMWFSCYNTVMTSEKFVYLFGRIIPALSLVLSMTLRFVPRFKAQLQTIREAQACVGRDGKGLKHAVAVLSILVTWSLENAIETADSMKSRGYGLPGRTAFSLYRFQNRDVAALVWLLACGGFVIAGWISGSFEFLYFPVIDGMLIPSCFHAVYLALCLTPVIFHGLEDRKWKHLQYKT